MPAEIRDFTVTIPAGTPIAAPVTVAITMPPRVVRWVRWRVPPGPKGLMGWALAAAGTNVIPWNAGGWIVADNEVETWNLEGQIDSGAWQVRGYNTGANPHSIYLAFGLDLPNVAPSALPGTLISLANLVPDPGTTPPPIPVDGHAAARANAIAAVEDALGVPLDVTRQPIPAALSAAAAVYAATRQAALDALAAILPGDAAPPPATAPGYDLGRVNARAAVELALGVPLDVTPGAKPAPGSPLFGDYARARVAAVAAITAIQPGT